MELDLNRGVVQVHDVMRAYFAQQLTDTTAVHARLTAALGDPHLVTDSYGLHWLAYHLTHAGQAERLRVLLLDYRWLKHKLDLAGIHALMKDFWHLPDDPVIGSVRRCLGQAAHILGHKSGDWAGTDQLPSQLLARMLHRPEPEIQQLCADARLAGESNGRPWLRPLTASLRSSSALLQTLTGHSGKVLALAVLPDGRLASASSDRTIRWWELATGMCEQTLEGQHGWVRELAVLQDGRLVSRSAPHHYKFTLPSTVEIWDLNGGKTESTPIWSAATVRSHSGPARWSPRHGIDGWHHQSLRDWTPIRPMPPCRAMMIG